MIITSAAFAAEIKLPQVSARLSGKMAHEALLEVLKVENVPQVLEKFKPIQEGLEWTPHPVVTEGEVSTVHLSFRQVPTAAAQQEVVEECSGGGVWGYFKGKVASTVSAITQVATNLFSHGEFIGEVTRSELSSARNVDGFRLDMDLNQSSLAISSLVTHFSIEFTFNDIGTPEAPLVEVELSCAMDPGMLFPGMQDVQVGPFIDNQLTAWAEAVKDAAQEQQARLLSAAH
ncbi:MAG: hypothetical protein ABIQ95_07115 [Bdellovibrionia bacterium]